MKCSLERLVAFMACASWMIVGCGPPASPPQPAPAVVAVDEPEEPPAAEPKPRFRCIVVLDVLGSEIAGEAHAEGKGDLRPEARRKACEAMRDVHGVDCRDDRKLVVSNRTTQVHIANGKMTQSVRITMRPVVAQLTGQAVSTHSNEQACESAIQRACGNTPDGAECHEAGIGCEVDPSDPSLWRCSRDIPRKREPQPAPDLFGR
ncbi:MAG: hypothetical protein ACOC1F_10925 [Myxococcota bacterium]